MPVPLLWSRGGSPTPIAPHNQPRRGSVRKAPVSLDPLAPPGRLPQGLLGSSGRNWRCDLAGSLRMQLAPRFDVSATAPPGATLQPATAAGGGAGAPASGCQPFGGGMFP